MLDLNKERLRHLVSSAVLEVWRKETGSLSAVSIEGTICVTSGSGRSVVIQVADQFTGAMTGHSSSNRSSRDGGGGYEKRLYKRQSVDGMMTSLETPHSSAAAMAAYLDDLSPASLVSPPADSADRNMTSAQQQQHLSSTGDRNAQDSGVFEETVTHHRPDLSVSQIEDKYMSDDDDADDCGVKHNDRSSFTDSHLNSSSCTTTTSTAAAGPVCAGTGYYTLDGRALPAATQEEDAHSDNNNKQSTADHMIDSAMEHQPSSGMDASIIGDYLKRTGDIERRVGGPLMSTPKRRYSRQTSRDATAAALVEAEHTHSAVLDLSRGKEAVAIADDLTLSPPHNYTAQVRDVIRRRLLAQKFSANQLQFEEQNVNNSASSAAASKCESSPGDSTNGSTGSDGKESGLSDSLPSTPLSGGFPGGGSAFLSPEANPLMAFPFTPFAHRRNMLLAAGQLHEWMQQQRNIPAALLPPIPPPQSPTAAATPAFLERPPSDPIVIAPPPTPLSQPSPTTTLSSDGRHTPQSATSGGGGEQKVYSCDFCHKTFLFKSKYQEHLPVHTNARPYQCRLCSRTYKYKYDLRVHLRTHLGIPTKSTLCPFCNDKFDTNKLLRHHIKDAHREHHKALTEEQIQMFDAI